MRFSNTRASSVVPKKKNNIHGNFVRNTSIYANLIFMLNCSIETAIALQWHSNPKINKEEKVSQTREREGMEKNMEFGSKGNDTRFQTKLKIE